MNKTLTGRLRELKLKIVLSGNPKSGRSRLWERSLTRGFITNFESVRTGFHKGARNWNWSLTRVVVRRASTVFSDCQTF